MRKSWYAISGATFGCLFLLGMAIVALAQDQASKPDYSWLNGKWRGPSPVFGGSTEFNLKVVSDNPVEGFEALERNLGRGKQTVRYPITGTVNGEIIDISILRDRGQVKLQLIHAEDSLKGKYKGEEVIYKKSQ